MERLHEIVGGLPESIDYQGTTYSLPTLVQADWAALEAELIKDRPEPLEAIAPHLGRFDTEQQRVLLERAYDDTAMGKHARAGEVEAWLLTTVGQRTKFWFSIRKAHPEVTRDLAWLMCEQLERTKLQAFHKLLKNIEGLPAGNSDGPEKMTDTEPKESLGDESPAILSGPQISPSAT